MRAIPAHIEWANRIAGWVVAELTTDAQLAVVAGVHRATVGAWRRGERSVDFSKLESAVRAWAADRPGVLNPVIREQCRAAITPSTPAEIVGNPDADGDRDVDWDDYRILHTRKLHLSAEAIELTTGQHIDNARVERNRTEQTILDRTASRALELITSTPPASRQNGYGFSLPNAGVRTHRAPAPSKRNP